jgi:thioredoxin 2
VENLIACPGCGAKNRLRPAGTRAPRCARCKTALPWVVNADDDSFDGEASCDVTVVVDLWAPWCRPCRAVEPVLEEIALANAERIKLVKVNVDECPRTSHRYRAIVVPLMVVLRDGAEVDRITGAMPRGLLTARLREALR